MQWKIANKTTTKKYHALAHHYQSKDSKQLLRYAGEVVESEIYSHESDANKETITFKGVRAYVIFN